MAFRMHVVVASINRAELLRKTIAQLANQTRRPDGVLVVSVRPEDVEGLDRSGPDAPEVIFAPLGLPHQRNAGMRHLAGRSDIITFLDDDFLPVPNYLEELEKMFMGLPDLVGATGRIIADGATNAGIGFEEALELIKQPPPAEPVERVMPALYGCNLSIRVAAAEGLWFDEDLPLYGWQEDVDLSYRLGKRGRLLLSSRISGVHMGTKSGRTSGTRLGYSQIANPMHLLAKSSIPRRLAWRLMARNVAANFVRSLKPEAHVDRVGRLRGNLIALGDLARGRLHPTRILSL